MRKRRLCLIAATVVLSLCCACADDGAVPAVEPDPEQSEPFLAVSPDTLFYDLSGNPLDASEFIVKTNCAWRLSVPEQADWCEASATSGQCDASVSFRLGGDPCYRVAELTFTAIAADGRLVITCPVVVQQGEKPDVDPTEPSDPDERPTDPSDPDDSSDPDKDPETSPAIPTIESVNPTALVWSANESGVVRQVDVTVKNFNNHVLSKPKITGADAGRFTASVNGSKVYVQTIDENNTAADYRATLEISVADGNSMSVSLTQSKRESEPDSGDSGDSSDGDSNGDGDGGDDGDGDGGDGGEKGEGSGEPNDPPGGGCDDFATLKPDFLHADRETPSGWQGFYCAVYSGDTGSDTAPYFRSLLGSKSSVRGLAMYNGPANLGRIESPDLHGGCGSLTFRYGVTEANKAVDFMVEILQNGTSVKSWPVRMSVAQYAANVFSEEVQLAGDFRIVIRNNATATAEYTTVFQITWTGYSAKTAAK